MKHSVRGAQFFCCDTTVSYSDGGSYRLEAGDMAVVTSLWLDKPVEVTNRGDRSAIFMVTHHLDINTHGDTRLEVRR